MVMVGNDKMLGAGQKFTISRVANKDVITDSSDHSHASMSINNALRVSSSVNGGGHIDIFTDDGNTDYGLVVNCFGGSAARSKGQIQLVNQHNLGGDMGISFVNEITGENEMVSTSIGFDQTQRRFGLYKAATAGGAASFETAKSVFELSSVPGHYGIDFKGPVTFSAATISDPNGLLSGGGSDPTFDSVTINNAGGVELDLTGGSTANIYADAEFYLRAGADGAGDLYLLADNFISCSKTVKIGGTDTNEGGQLTLSPKTNGSRIWNVDNYQERFRIFHEGDSTAERFTILTDGSIGIGTTSPDGFVEIKGDPGTSTGTDAGLKYAAIIYNTHNQTGDSTPETNDTSCVLKLRTGQTYWREDADAGTIFIGFHDKDDDIVSSFYGDNSENEIHWDDSISDSRRKMNIVDTANPHCSLESLMKLKVRDFEYKNAPGKVNTGFVAQELKQHWEPGVSDHEHLNEKEGLKPGDKGFRYMMLRAHKAPHPLLVQAIQDQQKIIESLEKRISALESK